MVKRENALDDERNLVRDILDGDASAFERLVGRYQGLVIHIVYRMITGREEREDLCQEVFMRIYRNLAGFRFQSKLSTWIARVAYNTCMNQLDKKREILLADLWPDLETCDDLSGNAETPDKIAETSDISSRLRTEIDQLPVAYRTILTLYHLDQLTYKEIGRIMDLPEGTVKSHLFRARKQLRARLLSRYRREDLLK